MERILFLILEAGYATYRTDMNMLKISIFLFLKEDFLLKISIKYIRKYLILLLGNYELGYHNQICLSNPYN